MRGFKTTAETTVTLKRPGASLEVKLAAPPFGWWAGLKAAYPEPMIYETGIVDGERVQTKTPDPDGKSAMWDDLASLCVGKALAMAGELEQKFPDPLPPAGELKALAESIRGELRRANLRDAEAHQLASAAMKLIQGDLPGLEEAREAGND